MTAASAVATLDAFEGAAMVPDGTTTTAILGTSSVDALKAAPVPVVERGAADRYALVAVGEART